MKAAGSYLKKGQQTAEEAEPAALRKGAAIGINKLMLELILANPSLSDAERKYLSWDIPHCMDSRAEAAKSDASRRGDLLEKVGLVEDRLNEALLASGTSPERQRAFYNIVRGSSWHDTGFTSPRTLGQNADAVADLLPGGRVFVAACLRIIPNF